MRIALCFSGHVRDLEYTKQFWTSLIEKYNIDVYCHFWGASRKLRTPYLKKSVKNQVILDEKDCIRLAYKIKYVYLPSNFG